MVLHGRPHKLCHVTRVAGTRLVLHVRTLVTVIIFFILINFSLDKALIQCRNLILITQKKKTIGKQEKQFKYTAIFRNVGKKQKTAQANPERYFGIHQ